MESTNRCSLKFFICTIILLARPAAGELLIYEPFEYLPTTEVNDGRFFGDQTQDYNRGQGLAAWIHRDRDGNGTVTGIAPANEGDIADEGVTFVDTFGNALPVSGNAYERRIRGGQVAASAAIDPSVIDRITEDCSTMWMSFLFQDFGFAGPDFGIGIHSANMVADDNQGLESPGYGVGFGIVACEGQGRCIRTAVYENSIGASSLPAEPQPTFNGPASSEVFLLALKVNWNPDGTFDEVFAFIIDDIMNEPSEEDAVISDVFDFDLETQRSLSVFNFSDTQVGYVDEIRVGTTFQSVMGQGGEVVDLEAQLAAVTAERDALLADIQLAYDEVNAATGGAAEEDLIAVAPTSSATIFDLVWTNSGLPADTIEMTIEFPEGTVANPVEFGFGTSIQGSVLTIDYQGTVTVINNPRIVFESPVELDFSRELMGQNGFGATAGEEGSGDFNLFGVEVPEGSFSGQNYFTLGAPNGSEYILTSMLAPVTSRFSSLELNPLTELYASLVATNEDAIAERDAAIAERDARPTTEEFSAVEAERDARFTEDQIRALSADYTIGLNAAGNVQMKFNIFESTDLSTFAPLTLNPDSVSVVDGSICLEFAPEDRAAFFRFSVE